MSTPPVTDRRIPIRPDDETHTQIRDMILKTNDPKERATLLILLRISESLEENTAETHGISAAVTTLTTGVTAHVERFNAHAKEDEIRVGKAKAAWWVVTGMVGVIALLGAMLLKYHLDKLTTVETQVEQLRRDVDQVRERHRIEDEVQKAQRR